MTEGLTPPGAASDGACMASSSSPAAVVNRKPRFMIVPGRRRSARAYENLEVEAAAGQEISLVQYAGEPEGAESVQSKVKFLRRTIFAAPSAFPL